MSFGAFILANFVNGFVKGLYQIWGFAVHFDILCDFPSVFVIF